MLYYFCLPSGDGYLVNENCKLVAQAARILIWRVHCTISREYEITQMVSERKVTGQLNIWYRRKTLNYVPLPSPLVFDYSINSFLIL